MALLPLPRPAPERMTGRAQSYLTVAAARHLLIGGACLADPRSFRSSSYDQIKELAPGGLFAWGVVGVLVGAACLVGSIAKREDVARAGLLGSAFITSLWAGGLFAAWHAGTLSGPTGPIIWTALTFKDLVVCRQPLRSPFEPLVRDALARRRERDRNGIAT